MKEDDWQKKKEKKKKKIDGDIYTNVGVECIAKMQEFAWLKREEDWKKDSSL